MLPLMKNQGQCGTEKAQANNMLIRVNGRIKNDCLSFLCDEATCTFHRIVCFIGASLELVHFVDRMRIRFTYVPELKNHVCLIFFRNQLRQWHKRMDT